MDKDEVICQLKQETVVILESEDEKAVHLAEKPEDSQHSKKKTKGLNVILHHCLGTFFSHFKEAISSVPCGTGYQVSMLPC